MVTFEQLRISDDGQRLFIDAHVNKADYFNWVDLSKVTICTEEQVSETDPQDYGDDFIYQAPVSMTSIRKAIYDKPKVLSEQQLLGTMLENGGWSVGAWIQYGATKSYMNIIFSGKYRTFDTSNGAPILVVATSAFNPLTDSPSSSEVLFTITGRQHTEEGHTTWRFEGGDNTQLNTTLYFYLYRRNLNGSYAFVRLNTTDDVNFLHFLCQGWYETSGDSQKEIHIVVDKAAFTSAFNNLKYDGEGKPYKEDGEWARLHNGPVATKSYDDADLSSHMFFVYLECEGEPDICTPCRLDEMTTLGVTFDYGIIFNQAMGFTRELSYDCDIPRNFIDFILTFDALKLAIETEHYVPAIGFWKRLTQSKSLEHSGLTKPCGCHG